LPALAHMHMGETQEKGQGGATPEKRIAPLKSDVMMNKRL